MTALPVIAFSLVPLRRRSDGWSHELQLRFIRALASGLTPGDAARSVGKNRQNAYALRKRKGPKALPPPGIRWSPTWRTSGPRAGR
jgi:hypothetical protein